MPILQSGANIVGHPVASRGPPSELPHLVLKWYIYIDQVSYFSQTKHVSSLPFLWNIVLYEHKVKCIFNFSLYWPLLLGKNGISFITYLPRNIKYQREKNCWKNIDHKEGIFSFLYESMFVQMWTANSLKIIIYKYQDKKKELFQRLKWVGVGWWNAYRPHPA